VLDSLRFGELDSERSCYSSITSSQIGHYWQLDGVHTVGGEVALEAPYRRRTAGQSDGAGLARADE